MGEREASSVNTNFGPSLAAVLTHEGGFVVNRHDPGGATCNGVTQAVYDDYRVNKGENIRSVRDIDQAEVEELYRKRYWNACRCDDLPAGVDYAVFDFAVNSGTNRAARMLQRALRIAEDGQIGPVTIGAARAMPARELVESICDLRICFLQQLVSFKFFGRGWTRRVAEVRETAKGMAA
jgi:lysozyme family protein